ncbi:hypothetical protein BB561_003623 [Smittium simulii]|uniref:Eukaryotic translation initiation factor 4E n=1 Tax=Smittium simulii TaxID=133385 RepID=A0A2T9YK71_9FUNG|nr:hypothetical protein BB561_003623 [Smittium simulii]
MTTVFADPVNFNAYHPLKNEWTLWYDCPSKKINEHNWTQNLKNLTNFKTIEDFWGVINNIVPSNELSLGANYHIFKSGIKPMWEDPNNERGGRLSISFQKSTGDRINDIWLQSLAFTIGANFEHDDEICGIIFSNRKVCFRISLWLKSYENRDATETIA